MPDTRAHARRPERLTGRFETARRGTRGAAATAEGFDAQAVVRRDAANLYAYLRLRLAVSEDAEDIAQEACLRFLKAGTAKRDIRNPRAYLYRIANNLVYHHYRAAGRRVREEIDPDTFESEESSLEERVGASLCFGQIRCALRELPPKCQTALLLRWRDGLRIAEIAERMTLSQAMVKKYLSQGLAHFRRRLQHCSTTLG